MILNDTLGRSIAGLKPNDQETGQIFTSAMERLIAEFETTILCSAHQPKSGDGISGTQVFLDNAPVTPHVEGIKSGGQLHGFKVTMEPKFRVGPPPKPFTVKARAVALPEVVNGSHSDLVFALDNGAVPEAHSAVRGRILASLSAHPLNFVYVCQASGLTRDQIANHVRGKIFDGKLKVKPDCRDLVVSDTDGMIPAKREDWFFRLPGASN
jgi:hypothetical protein